MKTSHTRQNTQSVAEMTEQEKFWAGQFGEDYIARNEATPDNISGNLFFFAKILPKLERRPDSIIEFGSNIGVNLRAIRLLQPQAHLTAIEINKSAVTRLREDNVAHEVIHSSLLEFSPTRKYKLSFIKGVMIHISPSQLVDLCHKLAGSSSDYVLIAEYYNRRSEKVEYRGHENKLFRSDFGGLFLDTCADFSLVDYGFSYYRDQFEQQDDLTWWLFQRK